MQNGDLVAVEEFCACHDIEISFISSLQQNGLIEITTIEQTRFIQIDQLPEVEKFVRLHYELDINIEGIETISNMLNRMRCMQEEITILRNQLRIYELNE